MLKDDEELGFILYCDSLVNDVLTSQSKCPEISFCFDF